MGVFRIIYYVWFFVGTADGELLRERSPVVFLIEAIMTLYTRLPLQ